MGLRLTSGIRRTLIVQNGEKCKFQKLDKQMYVKELRKKLLEEVNEYLKTNDDVETIEELSDVLEIIHSLSKIHDKSIKDVEEVRRKKFLKRGGFNERLYLIDVDDES
ncbi:nucleoside triphosphate pyrophosphohydrolase [Priestia megaterium]|nr:nucleoside triphosphate pyrophosphohydrolase [Priestia megaterium]